MNNILIDYIKNITMPVDPVCGIEMDETLALVHEHEGRKYFDAPMNLHSSKFKCPNCRYKIKPDSKFCRMCGSFPI